MSQCDHDEVPELALSPTAPTLTSRSTQERIVAAWQASGQTQSAYARELGIPANRLWYWIKRARERAAASEPTAYFTECRLSPVGGETPGAHALRVDGDCRNATLTLAPDVTPLFLATLLREVVQ